MTNEEFTEMISDFDSFMAKRGYFTMEEVSNYLLLNKETIRVRIHRGKYPGSVTIGHKYYIPFDELKSEQVLQ